MFIYRHKKGRSKLHPFLKIILIVGQLRIIDLIRFQLGQKRLNHFDTVNID